MQLILKGIYIAVYTKKAKIPKLVSGSCHRQDFETRWNDIINIFQAYFM